MIDLIKKRKQDIAALCQRCHVRQLDLFGSALRESDFDQARSDVDFLVEFDPGYRADAFDAYFNLKEGLEALLDRPVDLIVKKALRNPFIRDDIEYSREPVYGA